MGLNNADLLYCSYLRRPELLHHSNFICIVVTGGDLLVSLALIGLISLPPTVMD